MLLTAKEMCDDMTETTQVFHSVSTAPFVWTNHSIKKICSPVEGSLERGRLNFLHRSHRARFDVGHKRGRARDYGRPTLTR